MAASAQATPTGLTVAPEKISSTSSSPAPATTAPAAVWPAGRSPCRSHIQPTTATGAVYSTIRAGPTCMCCTAEK